MPTALDREGYKYYSCSNEHAPEHVHVKKDAGKAKFDISDGVQPVESKGMNTLTDIVPSASYSDGRVSV